MRLYFAPLFASLLLTTLASCQQKDPQFSVEVSKKTVSVGEPFEVKFNLEDGANGEYSPPDWPSAGFSVRGTSQSSSYSFSNGTRNSSAQYQYQLVAQDTGWLEIPSAVVTIGGAKKITEPQVIHVLPADDNTDAPSRSGEEQRMTPARENKKKIKTTRL
jgi:uncharacterized protein (DUF58 family)